MISDTHGLVRPEVYEAFDGVDLILHAGDVGGLDVIVELEAIAPVHAVVGNVDVNLRFREQATLQIENRTFHLQHVFQDIPREEDLPNGPIRNIIVFGHSHQPLNRQVGDSLYFNPGSAGPRRFKLPVAVGRLKLTPSDVERRIISLE